MIDIQLLLANGATYRKVNGNEIIFSEGDTCSFYYQLIKGSVKWINMDSDGRECIHAVIENGESFGEYPLFDDRPYTDSAIACSESVLIRLCKPAFLKMLEENSAVLFSFTRLLSNRLRSKFALIKSLGSNNPTLRILYLLNHLKVERRNFCPDCSQLKLTRQQIAGMTGLRIETVIRTMRNMHDNGDILINRGKVFYNNVT